MIPAEKNTENTGEEKKPCVEEGAELTDEEAAAASGGYGRRKEEPEPPRPL